LVGTDFLHLVEYVLLSLVRMGFFPLRIPQNEEVRGLLLEKFFLLTLRPNIGLDFLFGPLIGLTLIWLDLRFAVDF